MAEYYWIHRAIQVIHVGPKEMYSLLAGKYPKGRAGCIGDIIH